MHTDDLRTYLTNLPRGGVSAFARRVGVSRIYLAQLAARMNGREPSPELAVRIERESGSKVRVWALRRHDWHRIWPHLTEHADAPKQPVEQVDHV